MRLDHQKCSYHINHLCIILLLFKDIHRTSNICFRSLLVKISFMVTRVLNFLKRDSVIIRLFTLGVNLILASHWNVSTKILSYLVIGLCMQLCFRAKYRTHEDGFFQPSAQAAFVIFFHQVSKVLDSK